MKPAYRLFDLLTLGRALPQEHSRVCLITSRGIREWFIAAGGTSVGEPVIGLDEPRLLPEAQ